MIVFVKLVRLDSKGKIYEELQTKVKVLERNDGGDILVEGNFGSGDEIRMVNTNQYSDQPYARQLNFI